MSKGHNVTFRSCDSDLLLHIQHCNTLQYNATQRGRYTYSESDASRFELYLFFWFPSNCVPTRIPLPNSDVCANGIKSIQSHQKRLRCNFCDSCAISSFRADPFFQWAACRVSCGRLSRSPVGRALPPKSSREVEYGVALVSRMDKIKCLFCRILSVL